VKWWGTLAVAAVIILAAAVFFLRQGEQSYLEVTNTSRAAISVTVGAGDRTMGSATLDPGGRKFFNASNVGQWRVVCEDVASRRHAVFMSQRTETDRSHYFSLSLDGCSRVTANTVR
jgi:hypothetical protein